MWQFMPWDGLHAGLQHNWWIDERQDPEKATRAAARLLKDLYNQFGDWYLAMAAYNSGPGTVQRAVQRTGYADFWELYRRNVLPQETRNYVPIILAMTIMAKNPSQYGLDQLPLDPPIVADTVRIHYPIDLRLVAECTDSSIEVLQELNPSLLRMTTPKDFDFDLHLPAGMAAKFKTAVEAIPEDMRVYWRYHRVEASDTLGEIARRYHTSPEAIAAANNLQGEDLVSDAKLIIPVSPRSVAEPAMRTAALRSSKRATRYTVRKGDTVLSLSDDFGVSASKIRQWNHLKGNVLPVGRSLTIFNSESRATGPAERSSRNRGKASAEARKSKPERGSRAAAVNARQSSKKASHSTTPPRKKDKKDAASEPSRAKRRGQQS
jgi:membrane-bound lytic murein transglycosylase D